MPRVELPPQIESRLDAEEARGGLAKDCGALGIAQPWCREDVIDGGLRPRIRIIAAHDDLAGADLGDQVAQPLGSEDQRIVIELPQVFARFLFQRNRTSVRKGLGAD